VVIHVRCKHVRKHKSTACPVGLEQPRDTIYRFKGWKAPREVDAVMTIHVPMIENRMSDHETISRKFRDTRNRLSDRSRGTTSGLSLKGVRIGRNRGAGRSDARWL